MKLECGIKVSSMAVCDNPTTENDYLIHFPTFTSVDSVGVASSFPTMQIITNSRLKVVEICRFIIRQGCDPCFITVYISPEVTLDDLVKIDSRLYAREGETGTN